MLEEGVPSPRVFCWCGRWQIKYKTLPDWSHPFLFAAHVSLPTTLTGVASEATLRPGPRSPRGSRAGRPRPRPLWLRLRRPHLLWLRLLAWPAHQPHTHQARDSDTTSKTSLDYITKILELKRLIFFRFPHWQVHQTAAPVQAWCQEMSAYSQVTHFLITYSLTDLS